MRCARSSKRVGIATLYPDTDEAAGRAWPSRRNLGGHRFRVLAYLRRDDTAAIAAVVPGPVGRVLARSSWNGGRVWICPGVGGD